MAPPPNTKRCTGKTVIDENNTLATGANALCIGTAAIADGPADKAAVLVTYANIAHANYTDSLIAAQRL